MISKRLILRDWNRHDFVVEVDTASGLVGERSVRKGEDVPCNGFAWLDGATVAAVYADGGSVWIYVGGHAINCTNSNIRVTVHFLGADNRRVTVLDKQTMIYDHVYRVSSRAEWDPTFDGLDAELEDFWLWLSRQLDDRVWLSTIPIVWSTTKLKE
jgi:hypothetical protein